MTILRSIDMILQNAALHRKVIGVQVVLWLLFFLFLLLFYLHRSGVNAFSLAMPVSLTLFYTLAAYGNASWLIPKYYDQHKGKYLLYSAFFLCTITFIRVTFELFLIFPFLRSNIQLKNTYYSFVLISNFIAFLFGALLRIIINYFHLLHKQAALQYQQTKAELNLLKAQVQPHFLFNTLNNIYYLAYKKNENTPAAIAKLSEIMRYFVDNAPNEKIKIDTELKFIRNYIDLEQIRMVHPLLLNFETHIDEETLIPPMLLIPFIENIFKHGIDKTKSANWANIYLTQKENALYLKTENPVISGLKNEKGGVGLMNLQQRLHLLFGPAATLKTVQKGDVFVAEMKIPLFL